MAGSASGANVPEGLDETMLRRGLHIDQDLRFTARA